LAQQQRSMEFLRIQKALMASAKAHVAYSAERTGVSMTAPAPAPPAGRRRTGRTRPKESTLRAPKRVALPAHSISEIIEVPPGKLRKWKGSDDCQRPIPPPQHVVSGSGRVPCKRLATSL
jgi:hypothetical protein